MSLLSAKFKIAVLIGFLALLAVCYSFRFHLMFYVAGQRSYSKNIALSYLNGSNGFTPNYAKGRYWLRISSESGDAESMSNLAWLIDTGRGGAKNHEEALLWYQEAAKRGDKASGAYLRSRGLLK